MSGSINTGFDFRFKKLERYLVNQIPNLPAACVCQVSLIDLKECVQTTMGVVQEMLERNLSVLEIDGAELMFRAKHVDILNKLLTHSAIDEIKLKIDFNQKCGISKLQEQAQSTNWEWYKISFSCERLELIRTFRSLEILDVLA